MKRGGIKLRAQRLFHRVRLFDPKVSFGPVTSSSLAKSYPVRPDPDEEHGKWGEKERDR
jgi:hypothetical protein